MSGPERPTPSRRTTDPRMESLARQLEKVEEQVGRIDDRVDDVHKLLITEPEASPLGRALLGRSIVNADRIVAVEARVNTLVVGLDTRVNSLEETRDQDRGKRFAYATIAAAAAFLGTTLGVVASVLLILSRMPR